MKKAKKKNRKLLSVIVPLYKQENVVVESLRSVERAIQSLSYDYEIIAVVDGIEDNTYSQAKRIASPKLKVFGYKTNRGKGFALRLGMNNSSGDIIAFIDGGKDLDPVGIQMLLAHFEWYNADIIVGSKWHSVSIVSYPLWRKIMSIGYGIMVKLLFGLRISDTQLGMKCYRSAVLKKVLPRLLVKRFAFDIELLAVADRLGFKRIYDAPVVINWNSVESSISRSIFRSIFDTFVDTLAIFYRLKIIKYYDVGYKRKALYDEELDFMVNTGEKNL